MFKGLGVLSVCMISISCILRTHLSLVFGDMSNLSKSGSANTTRESLNVHERLKVRLII